MQKKRVIKQYENLSPELQDLVKVKYPFGYKKALIKLTTPDKKIVSAFPLETEDIYYLVKIPLAATSPPKIDPKIIDLDDDDDDLDDDDSDDLDEIDELPKPKKISIKNIGTDDDDDLNEIDEIDESDLDLDF